MIMVPDKFVFLASPRTGSRSMKNAIRDHYSDTYLLETREHHIHPADVFTDFPKAWEVPFYSVFREPMDLMLSWFYHAVVRNSPQRETPGQFMKFLQKGKVSWFLNDTMYPYAGLTTHPLVFDTPLETNFETMAGEEYIGEVDTHVGVLPRKVPHDEMAEDLADVVSTLQLIQWDVDVETRTIFARLEITVGKEEANGY